MLPHSGFPLAPQHHIERAAAAVLAGGTGSSAARDIRAGPATARRATSCHCSKFDTLTDDTV
tara:strand:+ start:236 stop:421 length:186 start_codon:yes stop_codon:yes gene_type:complete